MKRGSSVWQILLASIVLFALEFLLFSPALDYKFLNYDDDVYVYENANIQSLQAENIAWMFARPYYRSYTPLALLSHAIDFKLWENNPRGHHLTNVLLHGVNTILIFLLGVMLLHVARRKVSGQIPDSPPPLLMEADTSTILGAFVAALLFSLHPMRVESVAWISDRKDLLLVLFTLPCCMAYLKYDAHRGTKRAMRWYLLVLLFFVLALLSKTIAIVIPVVLFLLDMLLLKRKASNKWVPFATEKAPFFLLSLAFGIFAIISAKESQLSDIVAKLSGVQRALHPLYSLLFYPVKTIWPESLTPVYDSVGAPLMAVAAILCIVITVFAIIMAKRGQKFWLLAWLTYAVTIMPTITGLSVGIQPWADRYSYLPAASLMILLGAGVSVVWDRYRGKGARSLNLVLCAVAILLCGKLSAQQLPMWQNAETLWRHSIRVTPSVPMPYTNLGVALEGNGDHDGALLMYGKAVTLEPRCADALYNMGITYEAKQMNDSAASFYAQAITADRTYTDAYVNLGNIHVRAGAFDDAIRLFEQAVKLDSSDPDSYYNMGIAFYHKGDRTKALECFQKAVKYSPNYANAHNNIGIVFLDLGKQEAAMTSFVRAARLGSAEAQKLLSSKGFSW